MALRKFVPEVMVCGICSDLLKEPKVLVCAHTFCKRCLASSYADGSGNFDIDSKSRNKVECPSCLQITTFPDGSSIESLKTHSELEELIESLPSEQRRAVTEGLECRQKMIADLAEGRRTFPLCTLHGTQHQYYCTDCNVTACTECINDVHAVHHCSEISTFVVESLLQMQCLMQPSCAYVSRADLSLKKLAQDSESIDTNRSVCKKVISESFQKLRMAVDKREKMLLSSVDCYADQKLSEVAQQKKNLVEVQDQLYQSIQEAQQILDGMLSDITPLMDKQHLVEDIEMQEQNILDIESSISNCMFSSTYIGFRNDDTRLVEDHINELIALCELYPDGDTGYYASRLIPVCTADTEVLENSQKPEYGSYQNHSPVCTKIVEEEMDTEWDNENCETSSDAFQSETDSVSRPSIKRSQSTPNVVTKAMWLMKKRKHTASVTSAPSVPIRFGSLVTPPPVVTPEKVFDKLSVSKTEPVYPCGLCIGENNSFIISDVRNNCLRIIASNGKFIGAIGKEGKGFGQFEDPSAVASNEKAQIFACQRENPRIQKLASGGKYIQKFGHKSLRGSTLGEPWGIAIGPDHKLYVTDWDKSCIHIFCGNGRYDCTIGNDTSLLGESLKHPAGIAVDSSSRLVVADRGNHCVWVIKPDGTIQLCIGTKGHGPGELFLPYGVAVHPNGSIIVSESGNNRISVFSPHGKFLKYFGQKGGEPGMFAYPRHVCVTPGGDIVVADEQNQRLQLFKI
jgi:hypothetical protein